MKAEEVKATYLRKYFDMSAKDFMAQWKELTESEKEWYKAEYAKCAADIHPASE